MTNDALRTTSASPPLAPLQAPAVRFAYVAPAVSPPSPPAQERKGDSEIAGLKRAVEQANEAAAQKSIALRFGIHEASGEFYVRVLDPSTNRVIKTVPPEELLDFRAALEQSYGVLFDGIA